MHITRLVAVATTVVTLAGTALPALAVGPDFGRDGDHRRPGFPARIWEKTGQLTDKIRDRFSDRREDVEEKRQEHLDRLSDHLQDKLIAFWKRAATRMERIIDRLSGLADRLEERVAKLHENGVDVSEARSQLGQAREEIEQARETLRAASAEVEDIIANNPPREAFQKLRDLHKRVRTQIREAHRALIEVIRTIRGLHDEV
jgi:chromosome segregation ATPase